MTNQYKYYIIEGKIDGQVERLYSSYTKLDCIDELDSERDSWKGEGYRAIKLVTTTTTTAPDKGVYSKAELATNNRV